MELNVPTIAQRKAARRSQITQTENTSATNVAQPESSQTLTAPNASANIPVEQGIVSATVSETATSKPSTSSIETTVPSTPQILDKESLMALARSMGLELATPKKIWIKHSYSVTPDSKEKFSKYCEVLGIKMQDGLEDALQDWFKKKEAEYKAVCDVKQA